MLRRMDGGWAVCCANQRDPEDLFLNHHRLAVVLPAELVQRRRRLLRQGGGGRHFEMGLLGND